MDAKKGKKKGKKVRMKENEEKKRKKTRTEKMLKNSFKIFNEVERNMGKISNYIYTSLHDHASHFIHLLTEVSNEGSIY